MKVNEKLLNLRKANGMTQVQLAEMMNVSRQAISRWEVGESVPSTENLEFLGRLYDVPLESLLHDDAPEPTYADTGEKGDIKKCGENVNVKVKNVFLFVSVGIIMVVLCSILFGSKSKEPVPIEEIKGSNIETVDEFELTW